MHFLFVLGRTGLIVSVADTIRTPKTKGIGVAKARDDNQATHKNIETQSLLRQSQHIYTPETIKPNSKLLHTERSRIFTDQTQKHDMKILESHMGRE